MASYPDPPSRRVELPLLQVGRRNHKSCRWGCGDACYKEPPNQSGNETYAAVVERALSRRAFLAAGPYRPNPTGRQLAFTSIEPNTVDDVVLAEGYADRVLIAWGDPVRPGAPGFDFDAQTPDRQARQFGYNNDYLAFFPLPWWSANSFIGLLWANHEYTNPELMFRDHDADNPTRDQVDIQLQAHGGSIVLIQRDKHGGPFRYRQLSRYNRRITATTPMRLDGPAAGDALLQTSEDASGRRVSGMLNNCAGGVTPWGTVLTAEENFHQYFANLNAVTDPKVQAWHQRYLLPNRRLRAQVGALPRPLRPGQGAARALPLRLGGRDRPLRPRLHPAQAHQPRPVEARVRDHDPGQEQPRGRVHRRRRALRVLRQVRHQGEVPLVGPQAQPGPAGGGHPARGQAARRRHRRVDPLVHGQGPLTAANGFASQAEVLINTRGAGDAVGATKMDRPEDIQRNPVNGRVYVKLTNNTARTPAQTDPPNPRGPNPWGHVLEIREDGDDADSTSFTWRIFLLCGDPDDPGTYFAGYPKDKVSPIGSPDNMTFDNEGNIWLASDGTQPTGSNNGLFACPTEGSERGHVQLFATVPVGAETCGPLLTRDNRSLFIAVQHPGEGGTVAAPTSHWPGGGGSLPRPAVTSIWRNAGGDPTIGQETRG